MMFKAGQSLKLALNSPAGSELLAQKFWAIEINISHPFLRTTMTYDLTLLVLLKNTLHGILTAIPHLTKPNIPKLNHQTIYTVSLLIPLVPYSAACALRQVDIYIPNTRCRIE